MKSNITFIWILFIRLQSLTAVHWNPKTPIQFYGNASLQCNVQKNGIGTPKWTGGYMREVLTYNEASFYKDKYSVQLDIQNNLYYLNITNFNENDVNVVYSCFCGFQKYSKNLTLDESHFLLIPKHETVNKTLNFGNGTLNLNVTFLKVWPEPRCSLTINEVQLTSLMRNHTERRNIFIYSVFSLQYIINERSVFVHMSCTIGTQKFEVFAKQVQDTAMENEVLEQERNTYIGIVVVALFVAITLIISIAIVVYQYHNRPMKTESGYVEDVYSPIYQRNSASPYPSAVGSKPG